MEPVYTPVIGFARGLFAAQGLKFTILGDENVPTHGGAVMVINHTGYFDFAYAGLAAQKSGRLVRFMAKDSVFTHPVSGPLMRGMKHIPVDRAAGAGSYAAAVSALRDGEIVGVFPEATICRSFELKDFKSGAARMAREAGVPILPVVIWGSQRVWTKGHCRSGWAAPTSRSSISVGEPIPVAAGADLDEVDARVQGGDGRDARRRCAAYEPLTGADLSSSPRAGRHRADAGRGHPARPGGGRRAHPQAQGGARRKAPSEAAEQAGPKATRGPDSLPGMAPPRQRVPEGPAPDPAVQKLRVRYAKRGRLRFTSSRDFQRALERALRRADVPMAFSAGFHPHPRISYANAASTGTASEAEYFESAGDREGGPRVRAGRARRGAAGRDRHRPGGRGGAGGARRPPRGERLAGGGERDLGRGAARGRRALLERETVEVTRITKSGPRTFDVRRAIVSARVQGPGQAARETAANHEIRPDCAILRMVVRHTTPAVRPDDILTALREIADLAPPRPPLVTRLAQGPLDTATARVTDPLDPGPA